MGNCISKINKDHFFAYKEFMKNDIFFSKGIPGFRVDMFTRRTYTGTHSIKKFPEKLTQNPLQTGAWWRHLFLKRVDTKRYSMLS